jgi:hypothetical protein
MTCAVLRPCCVIANCGAVKQSGENTALHQPGFSATHSVPDGTVAPVGIACFYRHIVPDRTMVSNCRNRHCELRSSEAIRRKTQLRTTGGETSFIFHLPTVKCLLLNFR